MESCAYSTVCLGLGTKIQKETEGMIKTGKCCIT